MQLITKQKGMTGISLMVILALFGFAAVAMIKIIPVYLDSFKVADVVSSLADERGLGDKSNNEIATMVLKRLDVNQVDGINKDNIIIEKTKNNVFVDIDYEVRKAMFGNLDVVISFKKSVEAPAI
jgi:hypothetical protein